MTILNKHPPGSEAEATRHKALPHRDLHEGDGEVEALSQPLEGDEGLWGEAPGGHLTVWPLVFARGALALEAPDQQVHTGSSVLTHSRSTAAGARIHLAVLSCKGTSRRQGR